MDIQKGVRKQHVESPASASSMVGERGARLKGAVVVLRERSVSASPMEVDVVVSFLIVLRVHKGAQCSVKHTVEENDAYLQVVLKVLKGAHLSAKDMAVERGACSMVVEYAQKVCTEVQTSVLLMVEGSGVLSRVVPRVHVAGRIAV